MTNGNEITIQFGALADPIWMQLKKQGVNVKAYDVSHFQRAVDGIAQLHFLGCMGDAEVRRTSERLVGKIGRFAAALNTTKQQDNG